MTQGNRFKFRIYSRIRDIFGRAFARPYRMTATP